ncbi:hypothetical protein [Ornithinimicrobium sp. CNJ-824]|uniref:hypothetical protein n=1 Tax=Ornithinimicrobium sp. CNJ-824 TaxID=1904966 RepID=UPI00130145CB|nr:hypothetical protein [Ornithinimicrobium sp. CNJ-824]
MEITSAMEAFLEQERRAITENIRRTGVHLTYVAVAAAEGDEPACACCRALGTGPEEAEDAQDASATCSWRPGAIRPSCPRGWASRSATRPACSVPATPSSSCWVFHLERRPPC